MIRRAAQSLCPVCLRRIDARYEESALPPGEIWLRKTCPEHGDFSTPVWRGPGFANWTRPKTPSTPPLPETASRRGCPYDCGLCPDHGQHTCTALVEVTGRCNLRCPLCFADAGTRDAEPTLAELQKRFAVLNAHAGRCNLQISGGEPTLRADLPQIIAAARRADFGLIQLNSNGLRLAEAGYAASLRDAGLDSVYLQWDGLDDAVFQTLRGRALLAEKRRALTACAEAGLGVVLVMTVLAGVNADQIGAMLRFAVDETRVRGLHIQPAAFFGRYPGTLAENPRLTLPEVMTALDDQSAGLVRRTDFHPPGCEHALCSFSAVYARLPDARQLELLRGNDVCCGPDAPLPSAADGARKARAFVAGHWQGAARSAASAAIQPATPDKAPDTTLGAASGTAHDTTTKAVQDAADFGRFMTQAGAAQRFTLSCMAFQDALSLDLDRVRGCCIHVAAPDGRRIPFCLYNLTAVGGEALYR